MKKVILIIGILIVVVIVGGGYYLFFMENKPTRGGSQGNSGGIVSPVVSSGNAYDHYSKMIEIMNQLKVHIDPEFSTILKRNPLQASNADIPVIKKMVEKCKPALDEMEEGAMKASCVFPMKPIPAGMITMSIVSTHANQPLLNFLGLQTISKVMIYRGKVAEMENRNGDAIKDYIAVIKVGKHFDQTVLISRLIGLSMRNMASHALTELLSTPGSTAQSANIINELKGMEPPKGIDLVSIRDYELSLRPEDFDPAVKAEMEKAGESAFPNYSLMSTRYNISNVQQDLAYLGAGIRSYYNQNNKLPNTLDELTPGVIPVMVKDPFSEQGYRYSNNGNEVILYSVGPDRTDDQGKIEFETSANMDKKGDIVLHMTIK